MRLISALHSVSREDYSLIMIRIRKRRRNPAFYDIADVPIQNIKKPIYNVKTDITRANVKLRTLIDEEKYIEARTLFIEIIKSNRYHFQHLWRVKTDIDSNLITESNVFFIL